MIAKFINRILSSVENKHRLLNDKLALINSTRKVKEIMFNPISIIAELPGKSHQWRLMKHVALTVTLFLLITQVALAQQEVTVDNDFGVGIPLAWCRSSE